MRALTSGSLGVLILLLDVACGAVAVPTTPEPLYTVTSTVMQAPGSAPRACFAMPLPEPPIGCGGPDVRGLDMVSAPGATRYRNGVRATGVLRLVGTWDGQALALTRRPDAAQMSDQTQMPICAQETGTSSAEPPPPLMQKVMDDEALLKSHGILLLEFGPCKGTVFLGIAVADSKSVDFLTSRYGHVEIAGWLQPLG